MSGIKLQKFFGTGPKISPELLPDSAAQVASDVNLYSGDLIAYPKPVIVGDAGRTNISRLYGLKRPVPSLYYTMTIKRSDYYVSPTLPANDVKLIHINNIQALTVDIGTSGASTIFDVSDASNIGLDLEFSLTPDGIHAGGIRLTAWSAFTVGTPGQNAAYVTVYPLFYTASMGTVYYYNANVAGQGGTVNVVDNRTVDFLSWVPSVDIATPSGTSDVSEQRFYYSGDGVPKVSTHDLATNGTSPYPAGNDSYYELGLPLPTQQLTTSVSAAPTSSIDQFSRDESGVVTIKTVTDHNYKSGAIVTVSKFTNLQGTYVQSGTLITCTLAGAGWGLTTGAVVSLKFTSGTGNSGVYTVTTGVPYTINFQVTSTISVSTSGNVEVDMRSFNGVSIEVDAPTADTLTYYSPGFSITTRTLTGNDRTNVALAGPIRARSYLYTWITPWGEESIGSEPSEPVFLREGQTVTVSNFPSGPPAGKNFIKGVRLYRTVVGTTTADYLGIKTLWYKTPVSKIIKTPNEIAVTCPFPHNLIVGENIAIQIGSFQPAPAVSVKEIIDNFSFIFQNNDVSQLAPFGTYYPPDLGSAFFTRDISENPGLPITGIWWDDSSTNVVDSFSVSSLSGLLNSTSYTPPPKELSGLTTMATGQSNVLVGFVNNELYFSEPNQYHAWPIEYKVSLDHRIVGLAAMSGRLIAMTDAYAYIITGSDPAILGVQRVDARFPCLSKNSIVNTGEGVMYATREGLAMYNTSEGPQLVTRQLYNSDTWNADVDPTKLVAEFYNGSYFGGFHENTVAGGNGIIFSKADGEENSGYFTTFTQDFTALWHDNETNDMYLAGFNGDIFKWNNAYQPLNVYTWKSKVIKTQVPINLGAAKVIADYTTNPTSTWELEETTWDNTVSEWDNGGPVTFNLYIDKILWYTKELIDSNTFRLPAGYKTDTFEIEIKSALRVRSIHLAETPIALRTV